MATSAEDNVDRLRRAGLIIKDDLPVEMVAVVEGLTRDEVDVLVAVKRRLDEADRSRGAQPVKPGELPEFTNCMVF